MMRAKRRHTFWREGGQPLSVFLSEETVAVAAPIRVQVAPFWGGGESALTQYANETAFGWGFCTSGDL